MEIYTGALPESITRDHSPGEVYHTTVNVISKILKPDESLFSVKLELERKRLHNVAISRAPDKMTEFIVRKYLNRDDLFPAYVADFHVSSDRLALSLSPNSSISGWQVLSGEIDVEAIGYHFVPKENRE